MTTNQATPGDSHDADMAMMDALLHHALRPDTDSEERIQRVLDQLNDVVTEKNPTATTTTKPSAPASRRHTWFGILMAACVLLCFGILWAILLPGNSALAAVERSLASAEQSGPRLYHFAASCRWPLVGDQMIEGDLYVDGADRFVLRHPAPLAKSEFLIGGNEREKWVVPPRGPVLVGDGEMLQKWLAQQDKMATPYLHITSILQRMSKDYDLKILENTTINNVVCNHVRGTLRQGPNSNLPQVIELYAERGSGFAQRLILDWDLSAEQFGLSSLVIDYVENPQVPDNWFEHTCHHEGRAVLSRIP